MRFLPLALLLAACGSPSPTAPPDMTVRAPPDMTVRPAKKKRKRKLPADGGVPDLAVADLAHDAPPPKPRAATVLDDDPPPVVSRPKPRHVIVVHDDPPDPIIVHERAKPRPVEYVGPRGGHYHYSASGKKVYDRH